MQKGRRLPQILLGCERNGFKETKKMELERDLKGRADYADGCHRHGGVLLSGIVVSV